MSVNTIHASAVEGFLGTTGPRLIADGSIAAELLRQRIAGMGGHAPGHMLSHTPAVETLRRVRPVPLELHSNLLVSVVTRAYSQLLAGDASGARGWAHHADVLRIDRPPAPAGTS